MIYATRIHRINTGFYKRFKNSRGRDRMNSKLSWSSWDSSTSPLMSRSHVPWVFITKIRTLKRGGDEDEHEMWFNSWNLRNQKKNNEDSEEICDKFIGFCNQIPGHFFRQERSKYEICYLFAWLTSTNYIQVLHLFWLVCLICFWQGISDQLPKKQSVIFAWINIKHNTHLTKTTWRVVTWSLDSRRCISCSFVCMCFLF